MVAALVIPWRQVLAFVVQATIVNNRFIYILVYFSVLVECDESDELRRVW